MNSPSLGWGRPFANNASYRWKSDAKHFCSCSMFRCESKPSVSVTVAASSHNSCSAKMWNRTICS